LARGIFERHSKPLVTCEAALSEAFFLLSSVPGGTNRPLALMERGIINATFDLQDELSNVARLLRKYESVPMSLADACLVRMTELMANSTVFTLDSDFRIYRKHRRQTIPLICPD
jgi:uncharacterized protein